VTLLVRTWNLYHGRTKPNSGRAHLEQAVKLAADGRPDVVALQEVPVWALRSLEGWSGLRAVGAVARRGLGGRLAARVTAVAPDLFRSALTGQANALLVAPAHEIVGEPRAVRLNPGYRGERRICQVVEVEAGGARLRIGNLHATAHHAEQARREIERVAALFTGSGAAVVCGDFNVPGLGLAGFSEPIGGIDQILVSGARFERPPERWPDERRRVDGVLLSDHAPVEAVVAWP
jgi:endonuclease/exonuclease/phosphatase family metal-dependent hydrolase